MFREKDFSGIDKFDGTMTKYADWSDRVGAKLRKAHPAIPRLLAWAEEHIGPVTLAKEEAMTSTDFNVVAASTEIFDILLAKTTRDLYEKRKVAGDGRGLEFWRVMRRDFGMESVDAQHAKLQLFMKPARCGSMADLHAALDRWEAIGVQIGKPVDDDFKLIALKELVPKTMLEQLSTQVQLKKFPEAMAYVKSQVIEQGYANQVAQIQKQARGGGPAPMDIGSLEKNPLTVLLAAIEKMNSAPAEQAPAEEPADLWEGSDNPLDQVLFALKGKGKGKKGQAQWNETRKCFSCGRKGHLQAQCPDQSAAEPDFKGSKGKGKGKGKWGKGIGLLGEHQAETDHSPVGPGITLGCLTLNSVELDTASGKGDFQCMPCLAPLIVEEETVPLNACTREAEYWGDYVKVEVALDSGAAECVCSPGHFPEATTTEGRALRAGVQYVCADGGKIPNLGEKNVHGLLTSGSTLDIIFQVTQVDRPLVAVSKLAKAGHRIVFEGAGGYVINGVTGERNDFKLRDGIYLLDMWIPVSGRDVPCAGGMRQ